MHNYNLNQSVNKLVLPNKNLCARGDYYIFCNARIYSYDSKYETINTFGFFFHPHSMYLVCWCHINLCPDPRVWPEFKDLTEPDLVICLQTLFNRQVLHSSLHLSTNVIHVFWETNRDIDLTIWYDPEISSISAIFFSFLSLCFASCSSLILLIPTESSRFHNLNFHTHPIPFYLKYAADISKQLIFLHY